MHIFVSAFDCVDFIWDFSEILDFELKEARFCPQKAKFTKPKLRLIVGTSGALLRFAEVYTNFKRFFGTI